MLTIGELFTGIGGFSEGAERAGIRSVFQVEIDEWRRETLQKLYPDAKKYSAVEDFDGTKYRGKIDILCGGFPCQNITPAGKTEGLHGAKSILWNEFARITGETNPKYVLIENSSNLRKKGLEYVLHDLARLGYDAEWETISTKAFGMPHDRRRLFIIAYAAKVRRHVDVCGDAENIFAPIKRTIDQTFNAQTHPVLWYEQSMGERAVLGVDDGLRARSYLMPRMAGIGDAVSPVIAEYLFRCIQRHHASENQRRRKRNAAPS